MISTPEYSKSDSFRVATVAPTDSAMAAICASEWEMALPVLRHHHKDLRKEFRRKAVERKNMARKADRENPLNDIAEFFPPL
jgi:hypothetical protein